MTQKRIIIFLFLASAISFAYYYFFVDTLSMSQLARQTRSKKAKVLVGFIDLDSGLTRYDVYSVSKKGNYWKSRMREVRSIQDSVKRERARDRLLEEMMQDPSIRKIMRKLNAFGANSATEVLKALGAFR